MVSFEISISQRTPNAIQNYSKLIDFVIDFDRLIDFVNRVNSININATIFKFSEKFEPPLSHVFIFGNMFPDSHDFVTVPVTMSSLFTN